MLKEKKHACVRQWRGYSLQVHAISKLGHGLRFRERFACVERLTGELSKWDKSPWITPLSVCPTKTYRLCYNIRDEATDRQTDSTAFSSLARNGHVYSGAPRSASMSSAVWIFARWVFRTRMVTMVAMGRSYRTMPRSQNVCGYSVAI